eukprot:Awhi_evm1s1412
MLTVTVQTATQIKAGTYASVAFCFVMIFVTIGFIKPVAEDPDTFASIFVMCVGSVIILSALVHPREVLNLPCGAAFVLLIPMGYIFLLYYSIGNINSVGWGTRETRAGSGSDEVEESLAGKFFFWRKWNIKYPKWCFCCHTDEEEEEEKEVLVEKKEDNIAIVPLISEIDLTIIEDEGEEKEEE